MRSLFIGAKPIVPGLLFRLSGYTVFLSWHITNRSNGKGIFNRALAGVFIIIFYDHDFS